MKKLLIATAALAMVAGTAQAQSTVTVYGNLDVNFTSAETAGTGANSLMGDSGLSTSRLGFKGVEDLGSGLKAEFQLESKLTPSSGLAGAGTGTGSDASSVLFNREAWVGMSSATLGSIRVGTTDITGAQGLDSTVGQAGNFSDASSNLGTDLAKVVRYTTPTYSGFSAQVGYASPTASTSTAEVTDGSLTSVYAQYEAGNLGLYAGQVEKKISATYDQKETTFGAKYNFGVATVGAYRSVRDAASASDATSKGDFTQTIYSVSAPVAVLGTGVTAHGVYYKNEYDVANTSGDVDGYKLALSKAFSKRTTGYVAYVDQSDNKAGQTTNNIKTYVVGVNHAF